MRLRPVTPNSAARVRTAAAAGVLLVSLWVGGALADIVVTAPAVATPAELVQQAREAAGKDQNQISADFFRRAIEADPSLRQQILREYADQLTYSGAAKDAIPLYREILAGKPREDDARRAARGLALALLWSGDNPAAAEAWQKIVYANPADADARKNLRLALVAEARSAAAEDRNERAAELFSRAIDVDRNQRDELLLEYAEQLTYSGQGDKAVPLFRDVLSGKPTPEEMQRAQRGLALALQRSGDNADAAAAWQKVVDANPQDVDARDNLRRVLIAEARAAAAQNQNQRAAEFFGHAIDLDRGRNRELLLDYAEQLTYADQGDKAAPLFRDILAGDPSPDTRGRAERGLALALLWKGKSTEAAEAWQKVVDANPQDADARKNLRAALMAEARGAAAQNQNQRAADLFRRAIDLDKNSSGELLLDYAEQLTYSGHAADAVPLFRDVLAARPPGEEQRRAERGQALALLWSGNTEEAAQAWQKIVDANPHDADARKNLRQALIGEASAAAATQNDNGRAAEILRRAIDLDPEKRDTLRLDYAEQLTYSGKAEVAIPLFREILADDPSEDEAKRANRGLALALLWSGRGAEAAAAWQKIADADPQDTDARKNLREAIVAEARMAASKNQNARSAQLFAQAIGLDRGRRSELLREYAEQLSYSNRAAEAVPLFREALASGNLNAVDTMRARRGLALALLWSGQNAEAIRAWTAILRSNPKDKDARQNLSNAYVSAARYDASKDRNKQSADLFARAIATMPSRRLELAVEYGNQLTYSGRATTAVPLFREVLASGMLNEDQRLQAMLGLGLALSWSDRPKEALVVYDDAIAAYPDSADAYIGRGRALAQLDQNKKALKAFDKASQLAPGNQEAIRGAAQSLSYLGRQRLSLARLAPIMGPDAAPQTMFLAARAEYWKGRPDKAMAIIDGIIAEHPDDAEARKLQSDITLNNQPLTTLNGFVSTQNDGLVITGATLRHGVTTNDGLTVLGGQARSMVFIPEKKDDIFIESLGFFGRNRFNDMLELNGSVFLNSLTSETFQHVEPTGDVWLTLWPSDYLRFDISASRSYFDDVKSLSKNVLINSVGASVDFYPDPDLRLTGRTSYGWITDGNERFYGQIEAEQRVMHKPDIYLGTRFTNFDFAKPYLDNGYFNPDWLYSVEGTAKIFKQITDPWSAILTGSAGYEWQKDAEKPIWSAGFATSYSPTPEFNMHLEINHQDSTDVGGSSAFRRTTVSGGLQYRW